MKRRSQMWLIGATALLLLAAYLRYRVPLAVPPGLGMDELIALQISEQVLDGDLQLFYEAGQGREPIFNYWLAPWLPLMGRRVFTLRVASSALSLLGLAAVAVLARRLFDPGVALASLAGGAASFWTLFAARAGARSVAMIPFAALSGYLFWCGLASPAQSRRRSLFMIGAGLCLGLTFYTFTAARVLPAVFALFLLYLWVFHRPRLTGLGRPLLLGAIVVLLVALPLFCYLRTHPQADQFDFREFNRPLAALMSGDPKPALQTSLATLGGFAFRGDPLIFDNVPGRPVFEPLTAFLFLSGVAVALARWRQPAYAFILIWLLVSLIPGMLSQPAPNFYRIVGAQVVAFAFPGLAIVEGVRWLRRQYWIKNQSSTGSSRPVRTDAALVAILALILLVHLAGAWRAYFDTWPVVEGVSFFWQSGLAEAARYLDDAPDHSPVALCTVLTYEHDPWWRPAWQSMVYLLRRTDLDIRYYDCRATLVLPAGQAVRYLFPETSEPLSLIPAELQGEWLAEAAPIPDFLPAGLGAALELDDSPQTLEPNSGLAWWPPEAGGDPAPLPVRFGDSLALLGYRRVASPGPGQPLRLVTAWEVLATPPPRLVLFSHLLADPQTLAAQQDSLPLTSHSLRPGDRFLVLHDQIAIPSDSSAEQYLFSIGLYDSDTMARLPLYDGDRQRGDRLFLEAVSVAR